MEASNTPTSTNSEVLCRAKFRFFISELRFIRPSQSACIREKLALHGAYHIEVAARLKVPGKPATICSFHLPKVCCGENVAP